MNYLEDFFSEILLFYLKDIERNKMAFSLFLKKSLDVSETIIQHYRMSDFV